MNTFCLTILFISITITMNAQSWTPVVKGFSTPPIFQCTERICEGFAEITFSQQKWGISNSTELVIYLPYISSEEVSEHVFILNNGVIEAGELSVEAWSNVAKVTPKRNSLFTASGVKGVWFSLSYKVKQTRTEECNNISITH